MAVGAKTFRSIRFWVVTGVLVVSLTATGWPLQAEIWSIRFYRSHLSSLVSLTTHCRFQPTCSAYGLVVLQRDGFWRGNVELAARLARCSMLGYLIDRWRTPKEEETALKQDARSADSSLPPPEFSDVSIGRGRQPSFHPGQFEAENFQGTSDDMID
jgi:putative membrane protein insertion efficiency factor